ncbi:MAG: hypothetical protein LC114_09990 [Bryobacterales bacterium]|nr:hypothetical protein [Bryobacterales bacterium]
MRPSMLFELTIVLAIFLGLSQIGRTQGVPQPSTDMTVYDGLWWSTLTVEERSGFLEGSADCLTWAANVRGFSDPSARLVNKITRYYESHPEDKQTPVLDVWLRVRVAGAAKLAEGAEVWTTPHWYLNGLWWRQSSESERRGFLKGYLGCFLTRVDSPKEQYSLSVNSYMSKIDEYVKAHPGADDEAIAVILRKYKDRTPKRK